MAIATLTIYEAARKLKKGQVIAYPTEAVYGLGCDPFNHSAVMRLLEIKQRPVSAGLILIADDFSRFADIIAPVDRGLIEQTRETWPGPVTWLFPKSEQLPTWISGRHDSVALRVTDHPGCRKLCHAFGGAIVSTSANLRGKKPATSLAEFNGPLGDSVDGVVEGELGGRENPSEIRDVLTGKVLRSG
ncbi:MAG TPA: L-threonylcarbamoyladenylate synthase [Xanthomonadales bacterium]|nr:L-threonylcarbamoyladenylate synthase [Xanthomonadales bacterium]